MSRGERDRGTEPPAAEKTSQVYQVQSFFSWKTENSTHAGSSFPVLHEEERDAKFIPHQSVNSIDTWAENSLVSI